MFSSYQNMPLKKIYHVLTSHGHQPGHDSPILGVVAGTLRVRSPCLHSVVTMETTGGRIFLCTNLTLPPVLKRSLSFWTDFLPLCALVQAGGPLEPLGVVPPLDLPVLAAGSPLSSPE